jgi:hypothetical protein
MKIAQIKFPKISKQNKEKLLFLFYDTYISPLYNIYSNNLSKEKVVLFQEKENNNLCFNDINHKLIISKISSLLTKEIIEENYLLFLKIYQKYFCFENLKISRTQKNSLSHKAFVKCMEDFNISSQFLNSEQIEEIYDRIIDNKDYTENIMNNLINTDLCNNDGMWFSLFHFIVGIYLIAIFNVIITNYNKNKPNDILEIFIHNNDSHAFENIIKIIYKSDNIKNVMSEEIRKMQMKILKYRNKGPDSDEEKNYEEMNEKENSINSNKTYNTNNHRLLSNFENNLIRRNKSLTMKYDSNKKMSPIINMYANNLDEILTYSQIAPIILKKYKTQLISIYKYYSELYFETIFCSLSKSICFFHFKRMASVKFIISLCANDFIYSFILDNFS